MLMGIVNVTPDSFSDGGKLLEPEAAVAQALELQEDGADLLDFGAESTRPGADAVADEDQLKRLGPVIKAFRKQSQLPVSVDTQSAEVARACLDLGADIVNDVSAMRHDDGMASLVSQQGCPVILMHMLGTPRTMQADPSYDDVVRDIVAFFEERLRACDQAGIERSRVWIDPGIGFGKTLEHNLELLRRLDAFVKLGVPVLIGHSRKSFIGKITGELVPERRVGGSLAAGLIAIKNGASVLRVHDVAAHKQALAVWDALEHGSQK